MIITQFGKPDRKTGAGVGRESLGHADEGQALHLCRFVRPLADY
jgi:hypothetical protein